MDDNPPTKSISESTKLFFSPCKGLIRSHDCRVAKNLFNSSPFFPCFGRFALPPVLLQWIKSWPPEINVNGELLLKVGFEADFSHSFSLPFWQLFPVDFQKGKLSSHEHLISKKTTSEIARHVIYAYWNLTSWKTDICLIIELKWTSYSIGQTFTLFYTDACGRSVELSSRLSSVGVSHQRIIKAEIFQQKITHRQ